MAFEAVQPGLPPDIKHALQSGLKVFRSFREADPVLQQQLQETANAIPVFTLTAPDVLPDGKGLNGAKASGWRVVAGEPKKSIAADIYTMGPGNLAGAARVACIRRGPEIDKMLQAIAYLPAIARQLRPVQFHINLLVMPGLFTDGLWLEPRDPAASTSFIVPFHTKVAEVRAGDTAYLEAELLALLRPIAEKWKAYSSKLASRASAASAPDRQSET